MEVEGVKSTFFQLKYHVTRVIPLSICCTSYVNYRWMNDTNFGLLNNLWSRYFFYKEEIFTSSEYQKCHWVEKQYAN